MSLITVAHSLGMLCGSLVAGAAMDIFNLQVAFFIGAGIMAAGTVGFISGTRAPGKTAEKEG
jgi:predicted MFS family arabinose efflux permease